MEKNVFTAQGYRQFLRKILGDTQKTLSQAASVLDVSPAYLSRVLHGKGHLNREQIFIFGDFLELDEDSTQVLFLLSELEQATSSRYKKTLQQQINAVRSKKSELSSQLTSDVPPIKISTDFRSSIEYHLNPIFQIVHMALEIPYYQSRKTELAKQLQLALPEFERVIEKLMSFGLVKKVGSHLQATDTYLHLKAGDFISDQNHSNWRIHALRKMKTDSEQAYQYTATVSADDAAFLHFRDELKKLISSFSRAIQTSKNEMVFQINLDLFKILQSP